MKIYSIEDLATLFKVTVEQLDQEPNLPRPFTVCGQRRWSEKQIEAWIQIQVPPKHISTGPQGSPDVDHLSTKLKEAADAGFFTTPRTAVEVADFVWGDTKRATLVGRIWSQVRLTGYAMHHKPNRGGKSPSQYQVVQTEPPK